MCSHHIERDRMTITSEKQRDRFLDRARNDMKEGSPELWVIEIDDQMRATSVKVG